MHGDRVGGGGNGRTAVHDRLLAHANRSDHITPRAVAAWRERVAGIVEAVPVGDVAVESGDEFIAGGGAVEDADQLAGMIVDAEGDGAFNRRGEELDFDADFF